MIYQHRICLNEGERLPYGTAYRLYAWLLEQLPEEIAEGIHEQSGARLSQYLRYQKEEHKNLWILNVPNDETERVVAPLLREQAEIELQNSAPLRILSVEQKSISPQSLVFSGENEKYTVMEFLTPAAFKQAGRYAIYPSEQLILQSLTMHWNELIPELAVTDEDALRSLLQGIHITDYVLHTTRYPLKRTKIPSFVGRIVLEARLPLPLMQLWNALTGVAAYTGIGMKTALGMGGTAVRRTAAPFQKSKRGGA